MHFLAVGCLTLGLMAMLGSAQMDKASKAQSAGESELHSGRREDDRRGLLEPAGQGAQDFWRTGTVRAKCGAPEANEATTFVTTTDLMVGSAHVPAGNYTIFGDSE